ncbi:MAG: hypothetical protein UT48_C0018G0027 [Parcubacteria group bacterium GW2011_GWE2_39_37]|nr:MAG: hypothetical protein UT48_C0018G0027 [Parcubacteria group bacterium GW2011_GWE2_39_37]
MKPFSISPESLTERIGSTEFDAEGKIELKNSILDLSIVYGKELEAVNLAKGSEIYKKEDDDNWRMLHELKLNDCKGNELDLSPYLDKYRTAFLIKTNKKNGGRFFFDDSYQPAITVRADVLSMNGIITLLHEIGHLELINKQVKTGPDKNYYYSRAVSYIKTFNKKLFTKEERENPDFLEYIASYVLQTERDAWAFCLNKLRPFIRAGSINKEDILVMAHDWALQSYNDRLNSTLNPSLIESIKMKLVGSINTLLNRT